MKRVFLALFFGVLFLFPLLSAETEKYNLDSFLNNLTEINQQLSENEIILPSGAEKIISNGNISVGITRLNSTEQGVYFEVQNKRVMGITNGFPEKKAYGIFVSEETLNELLAQDSPDVLGAYKNGKIQVKAYGLGNNIKLFFAKIFLKFVD